MKQPHPRIRQPAFDRQPQRLANIPEQHVRALYIFQGTRRPAAVSLSNGLLDQAFFQPNPQIAGHDLHNVFGFERRRPRQQIASQRRLRRRTARCRDLTQHLADLKNAQALSGSFRQQLSSNRSQVAVLAIRSRERSLISSRKIGHHARQKRSADLQRSFLPRRKRFAGKKHSRDGALVDSAQLQIVGNDSGLPQLLGRSGDSLASFGKVSHAVQCTFPENKRK